MTSEPASSPRPIPDAPLRAGAAILALALVLVVLSCLTHAFERIDLRDESFLWYGAIAVTKGQVPMRDFESYDPGRYYWVAPWLMLLGRGIVPLRIACSAFHLPGLVCGLLVLRRLSHAWSVLIPAGALLALWLFPPFAMSHTVALIGVWVAVRLIERPSALRHFLAGVFVGLAGFMGRNLGLYAALSFGPLAALVWWRIDRRDLGRRALALAVGGIVGCTPLLMMMAIVPGFATVYLDALRWIAEAGTTNLALPVPWPWHASSSWAASVGAFFVVVPLFYAVAVAWALRAGKDALLHRPVLLAATMVGLPYLHYAFSRADLQHMGMGIHPFLLGVLALPFAVPRRWRIAAVALLAGASACSLVSVGQANPFYQRMTAPAGLEVPTRIGDWTVWMPQPMAVFLQGAMRFNASMVRPDEGFLIAPHLGPGLYAILNRDSPVWQIYFLHSPPEWWQRRMIDQFERNHVDWVLLEDVLTDGREELRFQHAYHFLWEHIMREFDPFPIDGLPMDLQMFRRRAGAAAPP